MCDYVFGISDCPNLNYMKEYSIFSSYKGKYSVQSEADNEVLTIETPVIARYLITIPKANPPVECTILSDVTSESKTVSMSGRTDVDVGCWIEEELAQDGNYTIEFTLRYIAARPETKLLRVDSVTGSKLSNLLSLDTANLLLKSYNTFSYFTKGRTITQLAFNLQIVVLNGEMKCLTALSHLVRYCLAETLV